MGRSVLGRTVTVPCSLDLEATHEHFHAHVALNGYDVAPGDAVRVEAAPDHVEFGTRALMLSQAEVRKAGLLHRWWTRLVGGFGFQELYDVGFE